MNADPIVETVAERDGLSVALYQDVDPQSPDDWDNLATFAREYVGADCTLDGEPAMVIGRSLDFAQVVTFGRTFAQCVEYAWPTVARVMAAGGAFKS